MSSTTSPVMPLDAVSITLYALSVALLVLALFFGFAPLSWVCMALRQDQNNCVLKQWMTITIAVVAFTLAILARNKFQFSSTT